MLEYYSFANDITNFFAEYKNVFQILEEYFIFNSTISFNIS